MIVSECQIRVRYADTDQMGVVYYGNYPIYYETGRTEALRMLGSSYKALEDYGIMMPVVEMQLFYLKSAHYDDLLTVKTIIRNKIGVRMRFDYEVYNQNGELLNHGYTILVFVSKQHGRACKPPQWFLDLFKGYNLD